MMSFLEKAWRRLIDMANRVQKDVSGRFDDRRRRGQALRRAHRCR